MVGETRPFHSLTQREGVLSVMGMLRQLTARGIARKEERHGSNRSKAGVLFAARSHVEGVLAPRIGNRL